MEVKINSVHFNADQKLQEFATKKVKKLETFFDGIIKAEVTLKVTKPETAKNKIAELKLSIPVMENLFAKKQADTFEEATDLAVDAVKKQLGKYKEKLKSK